MLYNTVVFWQGEEGAEAIGLLDDRGTEWLFHFVVQNFDVSDGHITDYKPWGDHDTVEHIPSGALNGNLVNTFFVLNRDMGYLGLVIQDWGN